MPVTKSFFQKIPFIRIASLFFTGILLKHYFSFDSYLIDVFVTGLISILITLWFASHFQLVKFQNILIVITIILTGYFYPEKSTSKITKLAEEKAYFLAEVCQKPKEKAKSFQTILLVQNSTQINPEKIIAYFSKSGFDTTINIGDQLIILGRLQEIRNMGNPFEFDYQSMMRKKDIWYSVYLSKGNYLKTQNHVTRIKYISEHIREKLISVLSSAIPEKKERSVIAALTLGYRVELEPETIDYFASTGAMHVLAVSGLHVGLIYFILGFLLSGIKRKRYGSFLFPVILILLLWTYAAITGFSASVQRATIMFTFIIIGEVLRRPVNIYNSLSASALVLMLLEPDVIFEVGFQLSYLAVFGIVLVQPRLARLIQIKNKILKFIWDLFTVSVAAQLATFPLGIFYFNQFPNYFWVSNFIVIPAATLIIWFAFAFYILSPLPVIAQFLAQLLSWITNLMIGLLKLISELPHAVSKGIIINTTQSFLIYGILISLLIFAFTKRKQWLTGSLILIVVIQSTFLINRYKLINQQIVYVYNSANNPIHFINGRKNYLVYKNQDTISESEKRMLENVLTQLKLAPPIVINKSEDDGFLSDDLKISGNKIQFLDCNITFSGKSFQKANRSDILIFRTQELMYKKKETINKTISTGSTYFTEKQKINIDHTTRTNGAFSLYLR